MSVLRDKLAALGHVASPRDDHTEVVPAPDDLAGLLDAREQACPSGTVLVRTTRFPIGAAWGDVDIAPPRFGPVLRGYLGADATSIREPGRTVFLDTETTGLTGGSGTYAFLVGIGRFSGDAFVLRQLFLRGPWEERALLEVASLLLEGAEAVVSYNGKSFDVPLLRSRLSYHGLPDPLRRSAHMDLLHISRRLWRERLGSCALGDVERGALGVGRTAQDVPGHLIPELYFSFLRTGDATPLRGVMHHNELDICSLAALLPHVDDLLEGRVDPSRMSPLDVVSLARTRESFGDSAAALMLFGEALGRQPGLRDMDPALACDAHLRAGRLAKRLARFAVAAQHWYDAVDAGSSGVTRLEAMVELAKLFEHQQRELARALDWVERCVADLAYVNDRLQRERFAADLAYRRTRLLDKLATRQDRSRAARQASSS